MGTLTVTRSPEELRGAQLEGLAGWRREVARRRPAVSGDREAQMDARRHSAGLERTRSAVRACVNRRGHGLAPPASGPRAVVAHRNDWVRDKWSDGLVARGFQVVGTCEDGAVALALTLVEQPEVLLLEDRLPWVTPLEVVREASRFAPRTVVAVQLEDTSDPDALQCAGATALFPRGASPAEVAEGVVALLAEVTIESMQA